MARIYLGNVKGPKGDTGATGATGPQGNAATIEVGAVSTTAYGNQAQVTNVGSSSAAKFDFVIPQGKPGEKTTTMSGLTLDTVTTSADEFPVPAVSENGSTVWGKVIKFFQDTVAALTGKLDANKIVNSQAVTEAGYGLDALQANPSVSGSLAAQISALNDSLNNKLIIQQEVITINAANTAEVKDIPLPDNVKYKNYFAFLIPHGSECMNYGFNWYIRGVGQTTLTIGCGATSARQYVVKVAYAII